MSFPISLTWANPPEGTCPSTFDEAIALYRTLLTGEVVIQLHPLRSGLDYASGGGSGQGVDQTGRGRATTGDIPLLLWELAPAVQREVQRDHDVQRQPVAVL